MLMLVGVLCPTNFPHIAMATCQTAYQSLYLEVYTLWLTNEFEGNSGHFLSPIGNKATEPSDLDTIFFLSKGAYKSVLIQPEL